MSTPAQKAFCIYSNNIFVNFDYGQKWVSFRIAVRSGLAETEAHREIYFAKQSLLASSSSRYRGGIKFCTSGNS